MNCTDAGKCNIASKRGLLPYHDDGGVDTSQWCRSKLEQYSRQLKRDQKNIQELDVKVEEWYLELVLRKSQEEEEEERKLVESGCRGGGGGASARTKIHVVGRVSQQ